MRVLIACEFSGSVRDAFRARGHDAVSCDLLPSEQPGPHLQTDVLSVLADGWDLMIAHPPCRFLTRAGAQLWRDPAWEASGREALAFVLALWNAPIERVALENPVGRLWSWWRPPDQSVQPFMFGEPYSKRTCLWLRGLPPLLATSVQAAPAAWCQGSYTRSDGTRGLAGRARSARDRSRTLPGVAAAMGDQWGGLA